MYYTAMKISSSLKDSLFLLASIVVALVVFISIFNDSSKTRAATEAAEVKDMVESVDPAKDLESLDNYITYSLPEGWNKQDQVDEELGNNTLISLTSPDFDSPETFVVNSGVRIIIDRTYDPAAEETLNTKLNAQYEFYDYNILPMEVGGKNSMTMHEDYEGHNRFIYIADGDHLWQISITSKSLEDEENYQGTIDNFLNSIQFKN